MFPYFSLYFARRSLYLVLVFACDSYLRLAGGTDVVIAGTHLGPGTFVLCRFGDMTVPAAVLNSTHVSCTSPSVLAEAPDAELARDVDVSVSVDGGFT